MNAHQSKAISALVVGLFTKTRQRQAMFHQNGMDGYITKRTLYQAKIARHIVDHGKNHISLI